MTNRDGRRSIRFADVDGLDLPYQSTQTTSSKRGIASIYSLISTSLPKPTSTTSTTANTITISRET